MTARMHYSPTQVKAIVLTPMITGSVSAIASGALITTILKSETKLSAPSKRILFGLCVYDCLLSLSCAFSSSLMPKEPGSWGAIGNVHTCDFQGFLMHVGSVGSVLYNCNLSIYYFCIIRFSMSEVTFRKKVEPFCHLIPNLYALGGAIYLLSKGYFNSACYMCWIAPYPNDCINNPDIECLRGGDAYRMRWIFSGYAMIIAWAIIVIVMISIVFMVVKQRRKSDRWASGGEGRVSSSSSDRPQEYKDPLVFDLKAMRAKTHRQSLISSALPPEPGTKDDHSSHESTGGVKGLRYSDPHPFDVKTVRAAGRTSMRSSNLKQTLENVRKDRNSELLEGGADRSRSSRQVSIKGLENPSQSMSLVGTIDTDANRQNPERISGGGSPEASPPEGSGRTPSTRGVSLDVASREVKIQALLYIMAFVICWIFPLIIRMREERNLDIPFIIFELRCIFYPIQGIFNVLVYVRPFVRSLRSQHPEFSWWKAFCLTVKSGGDNNVSGSNGRGNRKANQKVLDKIRKNHVEMMASIRQSRRSSVFDSRLRRSSTATTSGMDAGVANRSERASLDLVNNTWMKTNENDEEYKEIEAPSSVTDDGGFCGRGDNGDNTPLVQE